jgi:hypothetical protein
MSVRRQRHCNQRGQTKPGKCSVPATRLDWLRPIESAAWVFNFNVASLGRFARGVAKARKDLR